MFSCSFSVCSSPPSFLTKPLLNVTHLLVPVSVNGDYGKWSSWKKRIRPGNDPPPSNGAKDCYELERGPSEKRAHCFERSCPRELTCYVLSVHWENLRIDAVYNVCILIFLRAKEQLVCQFSHF